MCQNRIECNLIIVTSQLVWFFAIPGSFFFFFLPDLLWFILCFVNVFKLENKMVGCYQSMHRNQLSLAYSSSFFPNGKSLSVSILKKYASERNNKSTLVLMVNFKICIAATGESDWENCGWNGMGTSKGQRWLHINSNGYNRWDEKSTRVTRNSS